ncbi:hypothetical protein SDC9_124843 [bioreactor metagenome]|uniref:Uncharacterized protein n=1 Tax=bioreactor metagenome TaxID=1076179 RepID=A0A645CLR0_9ZZZZ
MAAVGHGQDIILEASARTDRARNFLIFKKQQVICDDPQPFAMIAASPFHIEGKVIGGHSFFNGRLLLAEDFPNFSVGIRIRRDIRTLHPDQRGLFHDDNPVE